MNTTTTPQSQFRPRVSAVLAMRYLLTRGSALSYVSRLALLGLVLSVTILVIVVSVVNGFERELRERVLSLLPHVSVYAPQGLDLADVAQIQALTGEQGMVGAAAVVQDSVLLVANGQLRGANLLGINPADYETVTTLQDHMLDDHQAQGLHALNDARFAIILGQGLADNLGLGVGDQVQVVMASGSLSPAGVIPRQRRFEVTGVIASESQLDSQFAYVSLEAGQKLFRTGRQVHGVHIAVRDLFYTRGVEAAIYDLALNPDIRVTNWQRNFGNLYQAIAVQKLTMFVLLSFLVAVAAFNLVSGLMMIVEQRQGDIAILRTMGASRATILVSFVLLGFSLAVVGVGLGIGIGGLSGMGLPGFYLWMNNNLELELMNQYFIAYLPVDVRLDDLLTIALVSLLMAVCAVLPPALRAARAQPSSVLAHE